MRRAHATIERRATVLERRVYLHAPIGPAARCRLLIVRSAHLEALRGLLAAASSGHGQLALISGEAGTGKSRLAAEIASEATTAGFLVLQGRCFEQDPSNPYAPLVDLLRSQLAQHAVAMRTAALDPSARELLVLLPGILPPPGDLVTEPGIDPEARQRRLVAALRRYLSNLADAQPLLLVFEDAQWSDDASLELLLHLSRFCTARRKARTAAQAPHEAACG